ncbi:hypothetical protein L0Z72_06650 [candidate division KSB1 bacterium]|nr:hypothetical protein [candidate division KSB1 bacterium]
MVNLFNLTSLIVFDIVQNKALFEVTKLRQPGISKEKQPNGKSQAT